MYQLRAAMVPLSSHSVLHNLAIVLTFILSFIPSARATLSLQDLQQISSFPPACEAAYKAPIQACPDASVFQQQAISDPGQSACNQGCFEALQEATSVIRKACAGSSAQRGTVIAHAFAGDLAVWLCTLGTGSGTQPATNANPTTTQGPPSTANSTPAASSAPDASTQITQPSSQEPSATAESSTDSSPTSSAESSSSSSSSSTSIPSNSPSHTPTSPTIARTTIRTSTSTSSSSKRPEPTLKPGGGSPFDNQSIPGSGATIIRQQHLLSCIIVVVFVVIFES